MQVINVQNCSSDSVIWGILVEWYGELATALPSLWVNTYKYMSPITTVSDCLTFINECIPITSMGSGSIIIPVLQMGN